MKLSAAPAVSLVSLGCSKNLVDAEYMSSIMREEGLRLTGNPAEAQVIIVNTCGFIESARQEAITTILDMADYKAAGSCDFLVVTGCMAQRYPEEIKESLPEVDAILGTSSYKDIAAVIEQLYIDNPDLRHREGGHTVLSLAEFQPDEALSHLRHRRTVSTGSFAYLKIAEGCSNTCTFCAIPGIRGAYQSRHYDEILAEARQLREDDIQEIVVVAQDTTAYGLDLYGTRRLPELLTDLSNLGFPRIRFLYAYTDGLSDELLEVMASHDNLVKYIDLPIQHASNRVLRRMGRRDSQERLRERFAMARKLMPDVTLRTTVMVGFPGETEEDIHELVEFIKEIRFDLLGSFIYSPEEGTSGEKLPGRIPGETGAERQRLIMETQQRISRAKNQERVGKVYHVLIEKISDDGLFYIGRTDWQAPEVDTVTFVIDQTEELRPGQIVQVKILEAAEYEFTGVSI